MNRIAGFIASLAVFAAMSAFVPAYAGDDAEAEAIQMLREQIAESREEVVKANLILTSKQKEDFWPLYNKYHEKRDKLVDERIKILTEYRDDRIGMTNDKAKEMLKDATKLEQDFADLQEKYRSKFVKVLLPRGAMRYYQIEHKIDALIAYDIAMNVPLAPK